MASRTASRRRFIDADAEQRCEWTLTLSDGSRAQCGRKHTDGQLCTQHAKMRAAWSCEYCGGNDENPPDHCADCERPGAAYAAAVIAYRALPKFVQCVACREYDEDATCPQCHGRAKP